MSKDLVLNFGLHEERKPMFRDVIDNQFFISLEGCLCQKHSHNSYVVISDADGEPFTFHSQALHDKKIKKLLPFVDLVKILGIEND